MLCDSASVVQITGPFISTCVDLLMIGAGFVYSETQQPLVLDCLPVCLKCSDFGTCTVCGDGFYLLDGTCLPCSIGCNTCTAFSEDCTPAPTTDPEPETEPEAVTDPVPEAELETVVFSPTSESNNLILVVSVICLHPKKLPYSHLISLIMIYWSIISNRD